MDTAPSISVVIPAHNEGMFIARTLASLRQQTCRDFEVIVVDSNSTDDTAAVAKRHGAMVVREPRPGVAWARQAGFAAARGRIIATTDADTILPPDWLARITERFSREPQLAAFGGLYRLYSGTKAAQFIFPRVAYRFWQLDRRLGGGWVLAGCNMAVRRQDFEAVGGFNTGLRAGEDADLARRLKTRGNVELDRNFLVDTSGRRYRKGFLVGVMTYLPQIILRDIFDRPVAGKLPPVRRENRSPVSLLPAAAAVILVSLLWTRGTVLAQTAHLGEEGGEQIVQRSSQFAAAHFWRWRQRQPARNIASSKIRHAQNHLFNF